MEEFLRKALSRNKTSIHSIQRSIRKGLIQKFQTNININHSPNAWDPDQLLSVDSTTFQSGSTRINDSIHFPDAEIFKKLHKEVCHQCNTNCSGRTVYHLLKYGWKPDFTILPQIVRDKIYDEKDCIISVNNEIQVLLQNHKLQFTTKESLKCILPVKIIVKADHIHQSSNLLHRSPYDLEKIGPDALNDALTRNGHNPVKTRLVIDFRAGNYNDMLEDFPFSYASIHDAVALAFKKRDPHFSKIDFTQYFLQVPIATESRDYLGISCRNQCYRYTGMPFGIKLAPAVASLVSAEIVRLAKLKFDIDSIVYLDDILVVSDGIDQAHQQKRQLLDLLTSLRFQVNEQKVLGPNKIMEFLGFIIDTQSRPFILSLSDIKVSAARAKVMDALSSQKLPYTDFLSLAGTLHYLSEVVHLGWSHTLILWNLVNETSSQRRNRHIWLTEEVIHHLNWWKDILQDADRLKTPTCPPPSIERLLQATKVYSDASKLDGYGFHTEERDIIWSDKWPTDMIDIKDTVVKELYPMVIFLETFGHQFRNQPLVWLTDNAAAAMTTNGGAARNRQPNELIMRILIASEKYKIMLLTFWIPRECNVFADVLSRASNFL